MGKLAEEASDGRGITPRLLAYWKASALRAGRPGAAQELRGRAHGQAGAAPCWVFQLARKLRLPRSLSKSLKKTETLDPG